MSNIPVIEVNPSKDSKGIIQRWWALPENEIHAHLVPIIKQIETRQFYRRVMNLRHARLYSNQELMGLQVGLFSQSAYQSMMSHRVSLNVSKSCVDTAASKIAKQKPRPMFLTIDGDDTLRRRAKNLTKYMDGAFETAQVYSNMQRGFTDSGIFGTGPVKFYKEDGKVKSERVLIDELLVDDADGIYGTPKQLHQSKYMSRDVLAELFPEHEEAIYAASSGLSSELQLSVNTNLVRVFETWKLRSGPSAKDGIHVIVMDGCTLMAEKYKKDYFPFVFQRWCNRVTGFYGLGIVEEVLGIHLELNKLLKTTQLAMHLMCVPRVFVENNSMVDTGKFNNEIGAVYKYTGANPPVFNTAPAMPPEVYAQTENLYRKAYELIGISQLSANSKKPEGLNSGVALREYNDIESDRFQLVGQRYEEAHMEAARIIIDLTKDLAAEGKDPFVKTRDGKKVEILKWSEVNLKEDECDMRVFPTSILPTQPAGKLQTVQELTQAGFIDKDMALSLLDFPDLEGFMSSQNASIEYINMMIEEMLDKGKPQDVEPEINIPLAIKMAQAAFIKARINKVDEDKLELLNQFITQCKDLMSAAAQPQTQPQGGPAPIGVPAPAPTSDLMPIQSQSGVA